MDEHLRYYAVEGCLYTQVKTLTQQILHDNSDFDEPDNPAESLLLYDERRVMSRLIIKGLPKHFNDANVRELFSFAGELTDAKVIRTKDGRSRQFGFVGFRTCQAAAVARKALDATYVGTARVSVEPAHAVGGDELPRPWSKYSEGSSRYKERRDVYRTDGGSHNLAQKRQKGKEPRGVFALNAQHGQEKKVKDARIEEFIEVARGRKAVPVWADSGISAKEKSTLVPSRKKGAEGKMLERKHVTFQDSDDEDDLSYQDFPRKQAVSGSVGGQGEDDEGNKTALDQKISDMDYFKSKMVALTKPSDSDNESPDQPATDASVNSFHETENQNHGEKDEPQGPDLDKDSDLADGTATTSDTENDKNTKNGKDPQHRRSVNEEKPAKPIKAVQKKYISEGVDAAETGRLLLRNLAFSTTEEELELCFEPFGTLADVHIVRDGKGGRSRGIGFVQYMIPENAAKALIQLDATFLNGRILHVLPAKPRSTAGLAKAARRKVSKLGSSSFKTEKEAARKEAAHLGQDSDAQHTLHMSSDAIAEIAARRHGVSKAELLGTEKGESGVAAVRLAMAEASIQQETRQYLLSQGIDLAKAVEVARELAASTSSAKRKRMSRVAFLVKNLPAGTTRTDLEKVFGCLGKINRLVVVPSGLLAVIEYATASDAKRAYNGLAYTKFQDTPLYLEWLPSAALAEPQLAQKDTEQAISEDAPGTASNYSSEVLKTNTDNVKQQTRTVYVKNLNFDTREKELREHYVRILRKRRRIASSLRSATVAMKKGKEGKSSERLSMGFGFLEFETAEDAMEAVKLAQNTTLDGHVLELKMSSLRVQSDFKQEAKRKRPSSARKPSAKLIVRNVAFEATRKDIRRLFSVFGQIKVVRLPRKMDGSHRGFAFVEFVSKGEAKAAMEALTSSHLYGRHLIIEYAEYNDDQLRSITELQEKTASYISKKRIRRNDGSALAMRDADSAEVDEFEHDEELQDALYG